MNYILEYEDLTEVYYFNDLLLESNLSYDEIIKILYECNFTDEEINILYTLNESIWSKIKSGASKLKTTANNLKTAYDTGKEVLQGKTDKLKGVASRVKDHFVKHKGKYILGGAALASGVGIPAALAGLGAGHLADKYSN